MTPRTQAIAYRIWAYCDPKGWNCTVREVADDLDLPMMTVRKICQMRGWNNRMRGVAHNNIDTPLYLAYEVQSQGPIII